eukprot:TRINITY_DN13966_c0_g2_i3.p1 TRINITY_DN13966_c0_g2~~TRINITY_DN13966_c0_g2_i3.p1  ORF type:complete len:140 (-),score=4.06 TRINITY_DN13966_c0_g2_i3:65-484(-)
MDVPGSWSRATFHLRILNKIDIRIWKLMKKHSWFSSFKSIFQTETFLGAITNKWHRSNFARLRLRTFGFNANRNWFQPGTHTEIPCPLCNSPVDDEIHFVFDCKAFDDLISHCVFFYKHFALRKDLVGLLSSEDEHFLK